MAIKDHRSGKDGGGAGSSGGALYDLRSCGCIASLLIRASPVLRHHRVLLAENKSPLTIVLAEKWKETAMRTLAATILVLSLVAVTAAAAEPITAGEWVTIHQASV